MRTEDLAIGYKTSLASGLNLNLKPGVTTLLGRNGAGKSTLLKTLTGELRPLHGSVIINDRHLNSFSKRELSKIFSIVTNQPHAAGGLRLHELVALGRIPYTGRLGILTEEDKKKINLAMESVGISHKRESFVAELSDGERQKGMIARGLVQETPIIIMDEPFSFLDVSSRLEMNALVVRLAHEQNKALLIATHEVTEAFDFSNQIWMFTADGFAAGTPEELIRNGAVDRLFPNPDIDFDRKTRRFRLKSK